MGLDGMKVEKEPVVTVLSLHQELLECGMIIVEVEDVLRDPKRKRRRFVHKVLYPKSTNPKIPYQKRSNSGLLSELKATIQIQVRLREEELERTDCETLISQIKLATS